MKIDRWTLATAIAEQHGVQDRIDALQIADEIETTARACCYPMSAALTYVTHERAIGEGDWTRSTGLSGPDFMRWCHRLNVAQVKPRIPDEGVN